MKIIFLAHALISAIFGVGLWLVPGRFLTLLGWVPQWVDLVTLAFSSFWGWRKSQWVEVALVVQSEVIFCILGFVGMILGLYQFPRDIPVIAYVLLVLVLGFAIAWFWALQVHNRS